MLDLFAGSGALGLEALSRGAASATFVELAAASAGAVRRNLAALGYEDRGRVVKADATRWTASHPDAVAAAGLVVLDPPYAERALDAVLRNLDLAASRGALVVAEHERGRKLPQLQRLRVQSERRYGDTALTIFEVADA